jgi:hypothetical protein
MSRVGKNMKFEKRGGGGINIGRPDPGGHIMRIQCGSETLLYGIRGYKNHSTLFLS